jgi:DNA-binding HxlR family transcriptional regulator
LAADTVSGSGNGARSGAQTLALLAAPLNIAVLRALEQGAQQQIDLRTAAGLPAQTTLRAQLGRLGKIQAIEKRRRNRFPGVLEYELTPGGRDLLVVAGALEDWRERAPEGPTPLGNNAAKVAVKALADGWSTSILRAIAAKPHSLTELDDVIRSLNYPSLARRLNALRLAGLVEARNGSGRGTPYAATRWLREGMAPLAAACHWEHRHLGRKSAGLTRIDVEATFLLAMPLLCLHGEPTGSCRLAVELGKGSRHSHAGVVVELATGRIASCATRLDGYPDAWISGPPSAWLAAIVDEDASHLQRGGDSHFACKLLDGLHDALFGVRSRRAPA